MNKIPITIITGHLGSGKTTLIQKVLDYFPAKKILLIENEFGEIGIDGEILAQNKNAVVELNSGSICCNIQSDLELILEKYVEEKRFFDHIVIEATGVANPAKIVKQFIAPSFLSEYFKVNSVVCVIDYLNFKKHSELPEFDLQLMTSDSYYLSKGEDNLESALCEVADFFDISKEHFVNERPITDWFLRESFLELDPNVSFKGGHSHYQKLALEIPGEFDPFVLESYLNVLFLQHAGRIFRSKGRLFFRKAQYPYLFQGVFDSISFSELVGGEDRSPEDKMNRMVFIGEGLNKEEIQLGLSNCLA